MSLCEKSEKLRRKNSKKIKFSETKTEKRCFQVFIVILGSKFSYNFGAKYYPKKL